VSPDLGGRAVTTPAPHRPSTEPLPTVLVTGAAGRLGRTVAHLFHEQGIPLLTTDVVDAGDVPYRFELADLRDHRAASALLTGIDVLVHIGNHPGIGATPPQVVFNENVSINENMFQGAAEQGVRAIVFASTVQLIGSHLDDRTVVTPPRRPVYPLDERAVPDPSNVYALSKTVSEVMLRYYAERCGLACTAVRFPMLHRHDPWVEVGDGGERPIDVFEAFTGLTYDDAASLLLAIVRADLPGCRVYLPATSHRHRDLTVGELIERYYPEVAAGTPDLVDLTTIVAELGWRPATTGGPSAADPDDHARSDPDPDPDPDPDQERRP
jgi:nucleoside-diphosphate-sugar epimerase